MLAHAFACSGSQAALREVAKQRRVRGRVVVTAAASLLRLREEGARPATFQATLSDDITSIDGIRVEQIVVVGYEHHPPIRGEIAV